MERRFYCERHWERRLYCEYVLSTAGPDHVDNLLDSISCSYFLQSLSLVVAKQETDVVEIEDENCGGCDPTP